MPPPNDFGYSAGGPTFAEVTQAAVNDIIEHGFDSAERIAFWVEQIKAAAFRSLTPPHVMEQALKDTMRAIYRAQVERGGILRYHPGLPRFTLERVAPRLRGELDRRILASAGLIKLDRERMVADTIQRFSGWATSIPAGGSDVVDRLAEKAKIRKPLASLPFAERRVAIDQSHKLSSALSEILAVDGGALAGHWVSHFNERNYNFRPEHKHFDVDDKLFVVRGNWALAKGLMKIDGYRYTDEIERPAEKPFCRCYYRWYYNLRSLPDEMLTVRGKEELSRVRLAA